MMICGIDPGFKSGAVALVGDDWCEVHDLPTFKAGGVDPHALADLLSGDGIDHVWIERVSSMPGQGVRSTFNFGYAVGQIHMAVALAHLPYSLVTPAKWKKHFGLSRDKDDSRKRAIQLYPKVANDLSRKKDADRAEALLIATFGGNEMRGTLNDDAERQRGKHGVVSMR